ncbi:hypothetical protein HYY74_06220 [Candidatus Woesearchaeota archaeon]|nr:hypothetical protein [Candidatus Woesearchaeota archaeon]
MQPPEELSNYIEEILNNIEKYADFIEIDTNHSQKAEQIKIKIYAHQPPTFIVSSAGSAMPVARKVKTLLEGNLDGYAFEVYSNSRKYIYFIIRVNK